MLRVGVLGAGGRMGREVCLAVCRDPELGLLAAADPQVAGADLSQLIGSEVPPVRVGKGIETFEEVSLDVVVDFTVADVAQRTMRWCAEHGVHAVVGTTGITNDAMSEMSALFSTSKANCVIAPNFAIGAVLMIRFAEMAAPFMDGAEIVELHHDGKLDAPSGTAIQSARRMAQARRATGRGPWPGDRTVSSVVEGSRGAEVEAGTRVHSVRLPGLIAHQEIIFGALGQSLSIRHDSYDRVSFMPGVLLAIKAVPSLSGLTRGLESLMGL